MEAIARQNRTEAIAASANISTEFDFPADTANEFLTFALASEEYAIDIRAVREIRAFEQPTRLVTAPPFIAGVISLRGDVIALVDLRLKFGMAAAFGERTAVIIVEVANGVFGVIVDSVSDVQAIAPSQIQPAPAFTAVVDAQFISGLAPMDEHMLILLDIRRLLSREEMMLVANPQPG